MKIVIMVGFVVLFASCSGQGEQAESKDAENPVVEQKAAEPKEAAPAEKPVAEQKAAEPKKAAPVEQAAVAGEYARLLEEVSETIEQFQKTDPGMKDFFDKASGYVVFPTVAKGAVGIGAAHGKGLAYEEGKLVGEVKLTQVTVGAQLGGQTYSEVLFLENKETMDSLKQSNFGLSAQVSATAAASGASANAKYKEGVAVFTMAKGGLMYEATVGGQEFKFIPPKE
jgi:lipid-binding SYLF domain-containing protein